MSHSVFRKFGSGVGGGTLEIQSGRGCAGAAGTLKSVAYTRVSSAEFCYPILD